LADFIFKNLPNVMSSSSVAGT